MYLLDTNIWLERLLNQERAGEVGRLLDAVPSSATWMTDFTLHSIGVILSRQRMPDVLLDFLDSLFVSGGVGVVRLLPTELASVAEAQQRYALDFDDGYQYVTAVKHDLVLVSLDSDFIRTGRGRSTPYAALRAFHEGRGDA